MDHDLTRELQSWAWRLGWRWYGITVPTGSVVGSKLLTAGDVELGRMEAGLGDPWGWVLATGDGEVREGSAPTGRVAKGMLLVEALLWAFVNEVDGWRVFRDDDEVRIFERLADDEEILRAAMRRSVDRLRGWVVDTGSNSTEGRWGEEAEALGVLVCRAMEMLDEEGLVPGGEGWEPEEDDAEIDQGQLDRTREALEALDE